MGASQSSGPWLTPKRSFSETTVDEPSQLPASWKAATANTMGKTRQPKPKQRLHQERLIHSAASLVAPIAKGYAGNSGESLDDLIQVGFVGLLSAAKRFDGRNGVPFASYAKPHIRGAILHHLRDQSAFVRLPRRQDEMRRRLRQGQDLKSPGTTVNMVPDWLVQWTALARPLPLEQLLAQAGGDTQIAMSPAGEVTATSTLDPYSPAQMHPLWHGTTVTRLLKLVSEKQRRVLQLVIVQGWSYRQAAAALGVSAPTVQRLLHAGLGELQRRLRSRPQPC